MTDHLIAPHGGVLVDGLAREDRIAELRELSRDWPSWDLTPRELCDLELLLNGGFSPLAGFLRRRDYERVLYEMRLCDGTLWPIPVTLDVPRTVAEAAAKTGFLALRDPEGVMLAALHVEEGSRRRGGDRLTFVGRADLVVDLQATRGLVSAEGKHVAEFDTERHTFFEAVVGAASPLVGRTLKEVGFRQTYQAAVVAIHRAGERVRAKLGEVRLKVGDTLLLLTDPGFRERWRDRNDFLLVSRLGGAAPGVTKKAWLAGAVTLGIVLVAGSGLLPILHASLAGALLLVLGKVLTPGEARAAVNLDVVILVFTDYLRLGLPLTVVVVSTVVCALGV